MHISVLNYLCYFLASKCQTMACGCANARIPCSEFCECQDLCCNKFNINHENSDYCNDSNDESDSESDDNPSSSEFDNSSSEDNDFDMF